MKLSIKTLMALALTVFVSVSCGTQSFVKPVKITKDTAEAALYQARVMQNNGTLTADQFATVRKAYDALKTAQDTVIDARVAYLADGSATKKAALDAALTALANELANLTRVAGDFGIIGGAQ